MSDETPPPNAPGEPAADRLLLVGNPNVGKSVIFGLLTGRYVTVSNYPGTTVEVSRGQGTVAGRAVEVVDTPGANSLSPNSEDEKVARDVVLDAGPKTVIHVADAKNLRRALLLTAQLAELEVPVVMALNMWDEAEARGIAIDLKRVREGVGVPVSSLVATERRGFRALTSSVAKARVATFRPEYGKPVESAAAEMMELLPDDMAGRRGLALMMLSGDNALEKDLATRAGGAGGAGPGFREAVAAVRERLQSKLAEPIAQVIQKRRAAAADALVAEAVTSSRAAAASGGLGRSAFFMGLGPLFFYAVGWRLASAALYTFSGDAPRIGALGHFGTELAVQALSLASMAAYSLSALRREYATGGSAASSLARLSTHPVGGGPVLLFVLWIIYRVVGVHGAGDCVDFLEGTVFGTLDQATGGYDGFVNGPLSRALAAVAGADGIVYAFFFGERSGLMSTGMTYAIAIVFPIVTLFFIAFGLMEDSGYLPRLALLADRIFKRVGLSGKAVLPMVLGLGCGAMATMTTRILETPRQRFIAILLLALAVPCSAQLGIITAVLAGISSTGVLIYVVVMAVALLGVGWAAASVLPGAHADFLLEVPPFRWPSPKNVLVKTYHRVKWFMREAVPLFLLGTFCLFVAERIGLLKVVETAAKPLVSGMLGLPVESTIGFILGFLRRDYGAIIIFEQFRAGDMRPDQALIALIVITLFVPCLAHLFVCIKELGWRKALLMDAIIFAFAFAVGGVVRLVLILTGLEITAAKITAAM